MSAQIHIFSSKENKLPTRSYELNLQLGENEEDAIKNLNGSRFHNGSPSDEIWFWETVKDAGGNNIHKFIIFSAPLAMPPDHLTLF